MRSFACLTGLVALALIAVLVLVHSLNQPWLKHRLQKLARTSAGVELDYRAARIAGLSEAEVEGLVIQSPAAVRPFAPHLVRVGRLDARWSLAALLLGRGPIIQRVAASDVTLTAVVDEHGRTSFDDLSSSGSTSAPGPTVPLSRVASKLLGTAPPVGQVDIDDITLILVRTEHGDVSDRTELTGVAIHLTASSAEPAARGWRAQAKLGSPANPLELGLKRVRRSAEMDDASARFWVAVDATSSALTASLDMRMIKQTFAAGVSVDHGLHVEASLRFDPDGRSDRCHGGAHRSGRWCGDRRGVD